MSEVSFPGDGHDGEQPPPAVPARDEIASGPERVTEDSTPDGPERVTGGDRQDGATDTPEDIHPDGDAGASAGPGNGDWLPGMPTWPEDDWDPEAEEARFLADLEAGRARIPEEWEIECRPPVTISLGDAADVDLVELAAVLGPDGLGGEVFARDRSADAMRPGPLLAALTERAAAGPERLGDNELLGASSPTPSWAWSWSPPRTRPGTGWTSPPPCRPGCPPPARRWPRG